MAHSSCGSKPISNVVVMIDCAGRFVVEAFYGPDQVVIDVIQPYGRPQSCMPNSAKRLLEVHEDMVKASLVFQVFLTEYSKIENVCPVVLLPALKPACSSLMISSACGSSLFRRILSIALLG